MARSVWSGTIEFGLVSIPVSLSAATENKSISFNQLHDKCGTRIKEQRYCPHCERVVEYDEIEKGYEYSKGQYVKITKEDLEKMPLPSKKVIVLDNFVKQDQIDPIYFNGTYFAEPDKAAERPYTLLMETLKKKDLVAIGTLALRNKERLCCIRVSEEALLVEVLLYPDEIRQHAQFKLSNKISEKELAVADHLVDLMSGEFEPEKYVDHYREAVNELIQSKIDGESHTDEIQRPRGGGKVLDLMEALQASLDSAQNASKAGKVKPKAAAAPSEKSSAASKKLAAPPEDSNEEKKMPDSKSKASSKNEKSNSKSAGKKRGAA